MTLVLKSLISPVLLVQGEQRPAHWSPPFSAALRSIATPALWLDLHKAAILILAAADTLQLVLAAAEHELSISASCIQGAVKACLQVACELAPLALDTRCATC